MTFPYSEVGGRLKSPSLTIYSLSCCEVCKEAQSLLEQKGFSYRYLEVDTISRQEILQVKRLINPAGEKSITYPVLQINDDQFIHGYNEEVWTEKIQACLTAKAC